MLSEEEYFEAKSFLRVYKDAFACIEQVARKNSTFDYNSKFYDLLKQGSLRKQIVFDENGNLKKGEFIRASPFFKMFDFVE